eukprot:TRINITY_DN20523_c0_g1_i3.p1 TRINITY_DN20523_c0_g1~~TRINITY_DN20523_c0_g1_i3.p1  ORF type:complete len:1125 (-),score=310.76 TRINITY_DN20523_c0_g1_i3:44-3382(-)
MAPAREVHLDLAGAAAALVDEESTGCFDWSRCSPAAEDFEQRRLEGSDEESIVSPTSPTKAFSTGLQEEPAAEESCDAVSTPLGSPRRSCQQAGQASVRRQLPQASSRSIAGGKESRGDVTLCVRLRPCFDEDDAVASVEGSSVRLRGVTAAEAARSCSSSLLGSPLKSESGYGSPGESRAPSDSVVCCDHAFAPETSQEEVFERAVYPIAEAVIRGYNGAVIAYGQTGAGKTHTMIGSKTGNARGIAPRAVSAIFAGLAARRASWRVEVSVLEVYNEKVRDLLAPGSNVTTVEIHEVRERDGGPMSFRCPDATLWSARTPDEALAALAEGCRRREVARTDMNHHSSRSHLVFSLNVVQMDREAGATLKSRLHLVDLAGSERLKRSMHEPYSPGRRGSGSLSARARVSGGGMRSPRSPRDQRREAGDINKSLSQLALVIQRLTTPGGTQYVPYRDSMLTRLLAESFGGSSKTCLIIACSPAMEDRDETRISLDFGRRAKLVRNKPQINLEVESEPSAVMKALVAKELLQVQLERDVLLAARDGLLAENASLREQQEKASARRCAQLEARAAEATRLAKEATDAFTRLQQDSRAIEAKLSAEADELRSLVKAGADRVAALLAEQAVLDRRFCEATEAAAAEKEDGRAASLARLEERLLALRAETQGELVAAEQSKASMRQQHAKQVAEFTRQLEESRAEAARLQEERSNAAQRAQEDRSALLRHWHEEVMRLREEKASATAALEEEKSSLWRRWQSEVENLQNAKEAAIADREQEKALLRQKWHEALEETSRLQMRAAAAEAKASEELASRSAAFEEAKAEIQRQCQNEVGRLLEEKAAEGARMEMERLALHRRQDEKEASQGREKVAEEARHQAEKAELQKKLHEALRESSRLKNDKAELEEQLQTCCSQAQDSLQASFEAQLQECRAMRAEEAGRLGEMQKMAAQRNDESRRRSERLEAELHELRQRLTDEFVVLAGSCRKPGSELLELKAGLETICVGRGEREAEQEPEGEEETASPKADNREGAHSPHFGGRHALSWGLLWSPSLADLAAHEQHRGMTSVQCRPAADGFAEDDLSAAHIPGDGQEEACWDVLVPRRIELDLTAVAGTEN